MSEAGVIRRQLGIMALGGLTVLDAVVWPDQRDGAPVRTLHLFLATPSHAGQVPPEQPEGCVEVLERREISGGVMVVARAPAEGPLRIALSPEAPRPGPEAAAPAAPVIVHEIAAAAPDTRLFAGRDSLFGQRLEESAETVVDWLSWHHDYHGATGAVIVNRAPPDSAAGSAEDFATALRRGLKARELEMAVAIVESAIPLGKPDLGPESHPFLAPDAPGKDRMEVPAADPWRSPLGQALIYEIAKWRFLAEARAMLTLDVTDLLAPRAAGAPSAFDACTTARSGVVLLVGRRIYPWRVRQGAPTRFADHICRQFDARRGIARWGVAPARAGLDATWRAIRVAYAKPDPNTTFPFWRAMGLRVPGRAASELAPKTSLIEDAQLLELATQVWGHKPIRPPVSKPKTAPKRAVEGGRTCIVTTMKNEGPFIMEWIAYHRAIGVDDFLIYTNDCSDGTDEMLDLLERKGICAHRDNPFRTMALKPQHAALQAAESEPMMQNAGWAICMDVDEFIDIKIGDGTLRALYTAMGEANMISLTWRLFGNCDVHGYEDRFLLDQFTTCAPEVVRKPHQAWGFKTLFRTIDIYKKLGVHRPKGLIPDLWDQVKWLNGSGRPMPKEMFRNGWRSTTETYGYDWVQLNHYAVRSAESFLVKRDRGRVNHVDRDQGLSYWFRMNHNAVEDRSIQRMIPALQAEWDRLMADPEIRAAHDYSVGKHREKIAELRATENYEKFYGELCSPRFEKYSRILHVFGSSVFNAGPGVIPPDLHEKDLPPDFLFTVEHVGEAEH
ncbi:glycosyltransferase family 2 protein [Sinirhodobacter ferrireducens]|uniref:Glycosyltransferase family 2 protein n=1 Tax=Paenirhodobacter ferrireducens TaxID=1215032 RepID=A0A443LVB2_9RHOB|nr:glycosyltransferase family 2 protein [Sinirhodobacter ferrireducens]RWR53099.1 glycosyltransferase family 2 protein [Sinirhodobacter ferrireducens]